MNIPGYRINRLIAEGGMAVVYLATQKSLGRPVALKLLKKFDTEEQSRRFLNEGQIIASLNHRNIITIYDIGMVQGRPYISMEYLEGGDLEHLIAEGMTTDQALDLIEQLGNCLEFVHHKGIIHRDIKPANILFHADRTPILSDFGIAKALNTDTKLTVDGTAMGSPHYLSPEQASCKPLDGRADIYGLGAVFYEMLTGSKLFGGDSYIDIVIAHLKEPIPLLPANLRRYQPLLNRMVAKNPDDRFGSAAELVEYVRNLRSKVKSTDRVAGRIEGIVEKVQQVPDTLDSGIRKAVSTSQPIYSKLLGRLRESPLRWPYAVVPVVVLALLIGWYSIDAPDTQVAKEPISVAATETAPPVQAASKDRKVQGGVSPIQERRQVSKPTPSPAVRQIAEKSARIEEYLLKARACLDEYKLTSPEGDNAYYYYQEVLRLYPEHEEARKGLNEIAEKYADLATGALNNFKYSTARSYIDTGLSIQPDNKRLLALSRRADDAAEDVSDRVVGGIKSILGSGWDGR